MLNRENFKQYDTETPVRKKIEKSDRTKGTEGLALLKEKEDKKFLRK